MQTTYSKNIYSYDSKGKFLNLVPSGATNDIYKTAPVFKKKVQKGEKLLASFNPLYRLDNKIFDLQEHHIINEDNFFI